MTPAPARRPSLRVERALQRDGHRVLAGMDEVGRGALAGPVTVGVVVIDETCRSAPQGVKDSKLLAPHARERMVPRIERWALAHAVGHASADEIDAVGIIAALRLAGCRALGAVSAAGIRPDLVILDGNHDWLTSPLDVGLLAFAHEDHVRDPAGDHDDQGRPEVLVGGRGQRAREGAARPRSWSTSAPTTRTPATAGSRTRGMPRPSTSTRCAAWALRAAPPVVAAAGDGR